MIRARRFRALEGRQRYFVMYESSEVEVFGRHAYLASVNHPRPRTREVVSHFRDTVLTIHSTVDRYGDDGGIVGTIRIKASDAQRVLIEMQALSARQITLHLGLVGATVFREHEEVSDLKNTESRMRGGHDDRSDWIVILEGIDEASVRREKQRVFDTAGWAEIASMEFGIYSHIVSKYHGTNRDL